MFNVISDKWIITETGKYGIRELLANAHKIKEIKGDNPLVEFGIYRFLFTFLMDALRPKETEDCFDILDEGAFDMGKIDGYISACEAEGVSFDIYDGTRPFLQEPKDCFKEKDRSAVTYLDKLSPTGTSKRFFDKRYESSAYMDDDEIVRYLVTTTLYIYDGNGYSTCISKAPVYSILKGENLFETLAMGLIPINKAERAYGRPYWIHGSVQGEGMTKAAPVVEPPLLFALTLPIRRVNVIDNTSIYYKGRFYFEAPSWKDPYVAYFGDKSMKPKEEHFKRWTDLLALCDPADGSLKVVDIYSSYLENDSLPIKIVSYEGLPTNSKYKDMRKSEFILPASYVGNTKLIGNAKEFAAKMTLCNSYLSKAVKDAFGENALVAYANLRFHEKADALFEKRLQSMEFNEEEWIEELKALATDTFDVYLDRKTSINTLTKALQHRAFMIGRFNKLIKKPEKSANECPQDADANKDSR